MEVLRKESTINIIVKQIIATTERQLPNAIEEIPAFIARQKIPGTK